MTYSLSGSFGWAGGGKSGAIVDLWATSRFGGFPIQNEAPPGGSPDAGPVTTGDTFGNPGAYYITGIAVLTDYYVRIQYGGQSYWGERTAASLGGVGGFAPTDSPAFTGIPTAPTASALTDDTQIATTAYTDTAVAVEKTRAQAAETANGAAIAAETTRAEAAEALLAPLANPALSGVPTAPTAAPGTNTTQIATTAFVEAVLGDSGWVNMTLVHSWTTSAVARYRKLNNVVYIEMTALNGVANPVATLPAGFRPSASQDETFVVLVDNTGTPGTGLMSVDTDGTVNLTNLNATIPTAGENIAASFIAGA